MATRVWDSPIHRLKRVTEQHHAEDDGPLGVQEVDGKDPRPPSLAENTAQDGSTEVVRIIVREERPTKR